MIILTKKIDLISDNKPNLIINLTAEERTKVKYSIELKSVDSEDIQIIKLNLERGLILNDGDILTNDQANFFVLIKAKLEPVITVKSDSKLTLLKAAYHLGNRHVSLEINDNYLRFSPDHVLESMLIKLGLNIYEELAPFFPEFGAYKH
ncbi:urease accessory protein UreE [Geminocystis sp. NIES-3708]|uniref:urease accessory protein UreE n=1 Tax=Geminocystis sp. NIES-3708 TaxID=1615909 RepID=UPI0005FCD663|nr:urease accessory protein UreE [Geminocystis sp. NIES-3708]BAQ62496.1 urease accessory protein UreE [Geminocystis sp. NIES-3708]